MKSRRPGAALGGLVAVTLTGCGLVLGLDSVRYLDALDATADALAPMDASTADSAIADAGPEAASDAADAGRCNPTAPFGPPVPVSSLNTPSQDLAARLSPDELTVYFSSDRPGGAGDYDIWVAKRAIRTASFGTATPLAGGVNTAGREGNSTVTADGLVLYVNVSGVGWGIGTNVASATRADPLGDFGALALVPTVAAADAGFSTLSPFVLPNHAALYVGSTLTGNYDLYRAARDAGSFSAAKPLGGLLINTPANEYDPAVTPDELTLFFSSDRGGGFGLQDMFVATRATTTAPFGTPVNLAALNTPGPDTPSWVSEDGCELYYTSVATPADGGPASNDIFLAERGR